uniref:MHC class I-like antigen recognition-like domain-containing protein n=1 Tax=Castor canadensis TaxID=51338 RepID=A0A8C0W7L3_CASCN
MSLPPPFFLFFAIGFGKPISFKFIQTSSFYNHSWIQNMGSGWLDEFQTHGWESESGSIIFLHTWSKGNFTDEQLTDLELLFRVYFIGLTQEIRNYASQFQFECKFTQLGELFRWFFLLLEIFSTNFCTILHYPIAL